MDQYPSRPSQLGPAEVPGVHQGLTTKEEVKLRILDKTHRKTARLRQFQQIMAAQDIDLDVPEVRAGCMAAAGATAYAPDPKPCPPLPPPAACAPDPKP